MKSELKADGKFFLVGLIGGIITLIIPVVMWNVWFLDYIDLQGKLWAWVLAPIFAAISAGIFVGFSYVKKPLTGRDLDAQEGGIEINPFWGWWIVALVIEIFIVAFSNT